MRTEDEETMFRSAPRAKCPLPEICAVTTSPGAVRGTNTTSPSLLPTPSPPAAIESIETLITAISHVVLRPAHPASASRARDLCPGLWESFRWQSSTPRALHDHAPPAR